MLAAMRISLEKVMQAFDLYSDRKLIFPDPDDADSFRLNKFDDDGNRIIWRDPNRQPVNVRNGFISLPSRRPAIQAARFRASSPRWIYSGEGAQAVPGAIFPAAARTRRVDSVTCGDGPTVSPF